MKKVILIILAFITVVNCDAQKLNTMEKVEIQLVRNATVKINYAGKTILVDPMLSSKHSFMSFVEQGKDLNPTLDLPFSAEEVVEGIDAVLLTHAHHDHLDPKALEILNKDIPLYAQIADKVALAHCQVSRSAMEAEAKKAGVDIIIPMDGEIIKL